MQWPGSHVYYKNLTIKYRQDFKSGSNWKKRIDVMIEWLSQEEESANCLFAYFNEPNTTAHDFEILSKQVFTQVKKADETVGYLLKKLDLIELLNRTNLLIVSDHGMAEVKYHSLIYFFLNKTHFFLSNYFSETFKNLLFYIYFSPYLRNGSVIKLDAFVSRLVHFA
jgi:predicted AlkP superfamily pyrophosphatase or phosphodiesterase